MSSFRNFIFDLDGTLIDSKPGIQQSFDYAYSLVYGRKNDKDITPFIGPPIAQLLQEHFKEDNPRIIDDFLEVFKLHYDTKGYLNTELYQNVKELLIMLNKTEANIYLATNKRKKPTKLILKHQAIDLYFNQIYGIDSHHERYVDKAGMLSTILDYHALQIDQTVMVGDTKHDQKAAEHNNISFIHANYGYGSISEHKFSINNIIEIINYL